MSHSQRKKQLSRFSKLFLFSFVALGSFSCSSAPSDLRAVAPSDSLVYLETNDVAAALEPIINNESFKRLAIEQPDLSAVEGVQLSIAVTGFEVTEQELNEENSIGRIQPKFVAIADTHAWGWQARSFAENQLGEFVNKVYGGGVTLESVDRDDGRHYTWTAQNEKKAYAVVAGSLVFFSNDESAIEKCQAVRRGDAEPISKNVRLPKVGAADLAAGYISSDGVSQISNLAGAAISTQATEDDEVKSFISRVLAELLRNSITDVSWTASKEGSLINDRIAFNLKPDLASLFVETISPNVVSKDLEDGFVPLDAFSVTRYQLKDPNAAWRSVVLAAAKQTDAVSGKLINTFSSSLFEPYGIEDPELFLNSVESNITTIKTDAAGDEPAVIAVVKNEADVKKSLAKEIDFTKPPQSLNNISFWRSADGEVTAAISGKTVVVGDSDAVSKCLAAMQTGQHFRLEAENSAPIITSAVDPDGALHIVEILSNNKESERAQPQKYLVTSGFDKEGLKRNVRSEFGLIGSLIELLAPAGGD